ncbi:uncharacterized protein LOC143040998 [Oratosquilla oratoria]|uniref:uncharacterized protein LOC143040998 n=1 Tax=Oratosquilla oratoria TaxID=337810 RepID=UPI003F775B48
MTSSTLAPSMEPDVDLRDDQVLRQFGQDTCTGEHGHIHLVSSYAGGGCDGKMSIPTMLAMLCVGVVTVSFNLGVLMRILRVYQRGQGLKPAFYLIGNLAFSDMAIGTYVVVVFTLHLSEPDDMWLHKSCFFNIGLATTACQSIILTIVFIALDKYIFIRHALHHSSIVTVPRVLLSLAAGWIFSIIIGILPAMGMYKHTGVCEPCIFASVVSKDFSILVFVTAVAIPYSIIVVLYTSLLIVALRIYKARRSAAASTTSGSMVMRFSSWKLTKSSTPASRTSSSSSKASKKAMKKKRLELAEGKRLTEFDSPNAHDALLEQVSNSTVPDSPLQLTCEGIRIEQGPDSNEICDQQTVQTCQSLQNGTDVECGRDKELNTNDLRDGTGASLINPEIDDGNTTKTSLDPDTAQNPETTPFLLTQDEKESEECTVIDEDRETNSGSTKDIRNSTTGEIVNANSEQNQGSTHVSIATAQVINKESQEHLHEQQTINHTLPEHKEADNGAKTGVAEEANGMADDESNTPVIKVNKIKSPSKPAKYLNNIITKSRDKVQFLKDFRAAKTVLFIVGSFTCTYVPFVVGSMVYILDNRTNKCLLHSLNNLLFIGVIINSLLNPLIYAYGYREFRVKTAHLKGILAKDKRRKNPKF